ncbi:MAG TPA: DUF4118 domain-containing protein, partial [Pyrinomonadaceae bacterium]|nr:DUF4118 domain-containing protein [Pyrinomonadaceae bacterium]
MSTLSKKWWWVDALSLLGIFAAAGLLVLLRGALNQTTVALAMLLVVMLTATFGGSRPAVINSLIGAFCFNFFFLPPYHTLRIADPENWVALVAFLSTAAIVGWLSAAARRRAEEAEAGRARVNQLYEELQANFALTSRAEALRQSERLKSALLDAVSHDIRTPLTSIKASVTTLLDEGAAEEAGGETVMLDDEARREMLHVIDEESDRLNRFVEGLIEMARIEAGAMNLRRRWIAVDEIVADALDRAAPRTRGHRVVTGFEPQLPVVRVDSRAVSEVIYTLVDNAAKYSPAGGPIRLTARREEGERVLIAVEDEGAGVPVHLRERVFDKFFRATRDGDSG